MGSQLLLDTITIKPARLEDKLRIAAEAGYDGVELRGNDLAEWSQAGRTLAELKDLLGRYNLVTPAFVTEVEVYSWHYGELEQSQEFNRALNQAFDQCETLAIPILIFPVMHTTGTLKETLRNYGWLCDRAAERNLVAGLEFIGHIPKVPNIQVAWDIVKAANRPNSGIVMDLFHFYRGGSQLEDLDPVPPDKIAIVHIDDAMALPREQLVGSKHRLYPGEGVVPVREILARLREKGYQGPYAIELFNESYWSSEPLEVATRARQASLTLL